MNHPPPVWPGLGLDERDHGGHPFASLFGREALPAGAAAQGNDFDSSGAPAFVPDPPASSRKSPWLALVLLALIATTVWYIWQNRTKLLEPRPPGNTDFIELHSDASALDPATALEALTPAPPALDPLDAATPDITHNIEAAERAASLVKALDSATTDQERLQVVASPETHRADVQRFFASLENRLNPVLLDPTPAIVLPLQGGPKIRLFRLVTQSCPKGAMVHLRDGPAGSSLLDWPLFVQTHEQRFDKFMENTRPPEELQAEWFSVLCKRRHDFDLPKDAQDAYLCLEAQGSLSTGGSRVLYVNKGLPAGRLLDSRLKWSEIYLADLLVGKGDIGGKLVHVVLDCTGTDTARK